LPKTVKNINLKILMLLSVGVLAVFLGFWLKKGYEEQQVYLQQKTDDLFKNTINKLQDSVLAVRLKPLEAVEAAQIRSISVNRKKDKPRLSLPKSVKLIARQSDTISFFSDTIRRSKLPVFNFTHSDTLFINKKISLDSLLRDTLRASKGMRAMKIFITSASDGNASTRLIPLLRSLGLKKDTLNKPETSNVKFDIKVVPKIPRKKQTKANNQGLTFSIKENSGKSFSVSFDTDTLSLGRISQIFGKELAREKLPESFRVQRFFGKKKIEPNGFKTAITSSFMPANSSYLAVFDKYKGYLFRKLLPQISFSVFLLALVSCSFWLIYRNLKRQQQLAALKNDFISNITHELKTPITTVGVAIEALQNFNALADPKLTKEYLEISKNELDRLSLLVDKVLKMSMFEQKNIELTPTDFDLKVVVETVLKSMKIQFEKVNAQVSFDYRGEAFGLHADRTHLTNVVFNLIDNAIKYSPERAEISVFLDGSPTEITLSVSDSGMGIPPEYVNKVFDKFFRVPQGDIHNTKGYGLGLSYVANIVAQHAGTITVTSELGKGSTFVVKLPASVTSP
jgi:two-component system, OmpR family, phosphate regulon sensor histidine kinase PhoR